MPTKQFDKKLRALKKEKRALIKKIKPIVKGLDKRLITNAEYERIAKPYRYAEININYRIRRRQRHISDYKFIQKRRRYLKSIQGLTSEDIRLKPKREDRAETLWEKHVRQMEEQTKIMELEFERIKRYM